MDGVHDLFDAPLRAARGQRSALSLPLFVKFVSGRDAARRRPGRGVLSLPL